jgi:hypothetical protein
VKKIFLFFFFIITVSSQAQTSVYHPFPDSGAVWAVNVICYNASCGEWSNHRYEYGQDTVVGLYFYKRVTLNMINHSATACSCPTGPEGGGYLRQDTSARKVFWVQQSYFANEFLLYDFNLNIGDTMTGILGGCNLIVNSIDSILIGSSYRKKINFNNDPCNRYSIIEGIGGTHGLVNNFCFAMGYEAVLNCFSENGITVYSTSITCTPYHAIACDSILSSNNLLSIVDHFTLFPNPATNEIRIESSKFKVQSVEVYDVMGRLTLNPSPKGEGLRVEVDVSKLSPGIYFVKVKGEKEERVGKFVKQ